MIEVNLLPGGKKRAARGGPKLSFKLPTMDTRPTDPWILGSAAVVVFVLAAAAFLHFTTNGQRAELEVAVEEAVADSARYFDLIQDYEALNARRDSVSQRVRVIQDIDGDRYTWPHIMDEVATALPDYTWLTTLIQVTGGEDLQFRLEGEAGNAFAMTRFMENLERSRFIRDVELVSAQQQVRTTGSGVQRVVNGFVLEARFERPPIDLLQTVPLLEEETPSAAEAEPAAPDAETTPPDTAQSSGGDPSRAGPS